MKTSRSTRLLTAIVAILSLLYMQLAVAAYACPALPAGPQHAAAAMADMPDCQGMDAAQPALCHVYSHGEPAKQSLDKSPLPDVPPFVPALLVLQLQFSDTTAACCTHATPPITLRRTTAPPLAIRNCCFRI